MLNIPADIINVIIEELRTQQYELPAFSTLRRLVQHVRSRVNRTIFQGVFHKLAQENENLDASGPFEGSRRKTALSLSTLERAT